MQIIKKNSSILLWIIIITLVLSATIYVRLYPLRAHLWSEAREKATLLSVLKIKADIQKEISLSHFGMPPAQSALLAQQEFDKTIRANKVHVNKLIDQMSDQLLKENKNESDPVYLLESDPFYYYDLTKNVLKNGQLGTETKNSKYLNSLMGAPDGLWQPVTALPYVGSALYLFIKLFSPTISLMTAVSYIPIIISVFMILAFFWTARILQLAPVASGLGALFLSLAPVVLKRSSLGWYDTDPLNILFPLILFSCLLKIIVQQHTLRAFVWAAAFVITLCLYTLFWQGWGFILVVGLSTITTCALWHKFAAPQTLCAPFVRLNIVILLGSITGIALLFGIQQFFILIQEGLKALNDFDKTSLTLWPDLFMTVGELKTSSLKAIVEAIGHPIFLATAMTGVGISLHDIFKNKNDSRTYALLALLVFLAITIILNLKAERFAILSIVPLALFLTIAINKLPFDPISTRIAFPKWATKLIFFVLFGTLIFLNGEKNIRTTLTPIFNSTWNKVLTDIKQSTPSDTIVNSWWPPGHFIKGIAERRVCFDGASLERGQTSYWFSNILLAQKEDLAVGLIRMLNSSGTRATEYLTNLGIKDSDAVRILKEIAPLSKEDVYKTLSPHIKTEHIQKLLSLTHGNNPNSVVLLYNELAEGNIILSLNGNWDIAKIEQINKDQNIRKKIPKKGTPEYISFIWSLAGGQPKFSQGLKKINQQAGKWLFENGIEIEQTQPQVRISSPTFGTGIPQSLVHLKDGKVTEDILADASLPYSILLYEEDGRPVCRLMDRSIANSLWVKLYFFEGAGLTHFTPLSQAKDLTGRTRIKAFRVIW